MQVLTYFDYLTPEIRDHFPIAQQALQEIPYWMLVKSISHRGKTISLVASNDPKDLHPAQNKALFVQLLMTPEDLKGQNHLLHSTEASATY